MLAGNDEPNTVMPAVENLKNDFGGKPGQMVIDCGFNTGANLAALTGQGIEPLMPPRQEVDTSAAERPDPSRPVPEPQRIHLPINPQNKVLDRGCFVWVQTTGKVAKTDGLE